jgi:hypothetical protein
MNGNVRQEATVADYNPPSAQALTFPDWQPQFRAALLETDPQQLHQRVITAEEAIFTRMQVLVNASNGDTERHAIEEAMRQLRVIQVEKLNYPDWKKK